MTTVIQDVGSVPRTITSVEIIDAASAAKAVPQIWVRDSNGVNRLVYSIAPPLSAEASPATVSGDTLGTGTATTNASTVTPTGGTPPYTYAWELVSYDNPTPPNADSSTAATSTFTQTGIGVAESYSAVWRCLVTDSTPGSPFTAYSNNVMSFWSDTT